MHILIILKPPYKLFTANDIDSCISAQWPDPISEPLLFQTVKKCMVHGPCGAFNPHAICMEHGCYHKYYPKQFQEFTTFDTDGYPNYARPEDGHQYEVHGHLLDNHWIVPYCPYLSAKYDCHINVECATNIQSIKYPFKYIHKGGDRATLELELDEIKSFLDGQYIAAPEAIWQILHFSTHSQKPNVVQLQVHLPGQHMTTFNENEDPALILE
jgi:hypothetical protein